MLRNEKMQQKGFEPNQMIIMLLLLLLLLRGLQNGLGNFEEGLLNFKESFTYLQLVLTLIMGSSVLDAPI